MAPNSTITETGVLNEDDVEIIDANARVIENVKKTQDVPFKTQIVWGNVIHFVILHLLALYGFSLLFTSAKILTTIATFGLWIFSMVGITGGAHRLWSHRAYKAKLPLQLILITLNTIAWQDSVIHWSRDHRVHHKYTETNADPYSAARGFFFSHMGWLMCRKHPDVIAKGKSIDLSDLKSDPVLRFQHKHYYVLMPIACFLLPTLIPWYFWGESLKNAFLTCGVLRYTIALHCTWLINSAAHMYGNKPYDKSIYAGENRKISMFAVGEGWHNFHHVFPWDYRAAEIQSLIFNFTHEFINFFARIGWAYDLKAVSQETIEKRCKRTGDGTHPIWGWGDKDQHPEERKTAIIYNNKNKAE